MTTTQQPTYGLFPPIKTVVDKGYYVPNFLAFTAFPFQVGSQFPEKGVRPYAWDDLLARPALFLPIVILPSLVVYSIFKALK